MFCEQCGAELEQDARFCATCGKSCAGGRASALGSAIWRKAVPAAVLGAIVVLGGILLWGLLPGRSDLGQDAQRTLGAVGSSKKEPELVDIGVAGGSKELTRDMAARMITEHLGYPIPVEGSIDEEVLYPVHTGPRDSETQLKQLGLIATRRGCKLENPDPNIACAVIELTDEGKNILLEKNSLRRLARCKQ